MKKTTKQKIIKYSRIIASLMPLIFLFSSLWYIAKGNSIGLNIMATSVAVIPVCFVINALLGEKE